MGMPSWQRALPHFQQLSYVMGNLALGTRCVLQHAKAISSAL